MVDQEIFLVKQRIMKLEEQLKEKSAENRKTGIAGLILQDMEDDQNFRNMSITDRKTLMSGYDEFKKELKHTLNQMEAQKAIQDFGPQGVSTEGVMTSDGEKEKMIHAQGSESNMDDK